MEIADVMSRDLVTLMPGHSIQHAAQIMLDHHVSGLPVIDGDGRLVGILTEGDLLRRVEFGLGERDGSRAASPEGTARDFVRSHSWCVEDVMSQPVVTVSEDTSLAEIADLFRTRGIKRVPVMRGEKVIGVISRADLLKRIAAGAQGRGAGGDEAIRISAEAHLRDAADMFLERPRVTVEGGVVHLWGEVRSDAERAAARVAVEGVRGINGVEDHLTIVPQK